MIRFVIKQGENVTLTPWEEETVKSGTAATASQRMAQLRAEHGPDARISVERDPYPPRAPQEWVRFVLTEKDGTVRFSNPILKAEADKVGAELAADPQYADATIGRQE